MLEFREPCLGSASSLLLAVNLLITVALGIRMPRDAENKPDFHDRPPFFFKEVRFASLAITLVFDTVRFFYSVVLLDISVLLVSVRLLCTALQFMDHYWLCRNWRVFFVEKQLRGYLWFRFYVIIVVYYASFALLDNTMLYNGALGPSFGFRFVEAINYTFWYLWGKKFHVKWGKIVDMSEARRLPSLRYAIMCDCVIFAIKAYYDYSVIGQPKLGIVDVYGVVFFGVVSGVLRYQEHRQTNIALAFMQSFKESKRDESHASEAEREREQTRAQEQREEAKTQERDLQRVEAANLRHSMRMATSQRRTFKLEGDEAPAAAPLGSLNGLGGGPGGGLEPYASERGLNVGTVAGTDVETGKPDVAYDDLIKPAAVPSARLVVNRGQELADSPAGATVLAAGGGAATGNDGDGAYDCRVEDVEEEEDEEEEEEDYSNVTFFSIRHNGVELVPKLPPLRLPNGTASQLVIPSEAGSDMISSVVTSRRASLEKQVRRDHTSHLLMDKVVAVTAQVLVWFVLVHFAEFGLNVYFLDQASGQSALQWCADFSFNFSSSSSFGVVQKLFDMFA